MCLLGSRRILPSSIDRTLDRSRSEGASFRVPGLSRLDRPTGVSGSMRVVPGDTETASPGQRRERGTSLSVGATAEVKSKLSVLEVVGESVTLKKAGTTYKGLCPFHGEKTPSFIVTPMRETWHCFGCGRGGDIFSFVMERDGLTFPEALRSLAAKAGVEIDERTKREDARKARLRGVLDTAIAFYHAVLTGSKSGERALAYLKERGFTDATIETFQLGWAPGRLGPDVAPAPGQARHPTRGARSRSGWPAPASAAAARSTSSAPASCSRSATRTATRSGSAGGCWKGRGPKYLNSPATPLFDKSRTLYLIDRAKGPIRKSKPGGHRRGLHRRPDGPSGGLRQRRRQPRHGADAEPDRSADAVREPHRARLRRRPGRREGRARSASPR